MAVLRSEATPTRRRPFERAHWSGRRFGVTAARTLDDLPGPTQTTVHPPAQLSGGRYPRDPERQRAFQVWSQLYTGQPVNAKDVLRAAQFDKNESTVRRWCRAWEREADLDSAVAETVQPSVRRSA